MLKKTQEFQGIVLVGGYGSRMPELTDDIPKPLLPVANVPMFWYALDILRKNSIMDVLMLTNERCHARINQLLSDGSLPPLPSEMKIELVNTGAHGRDWGTIQALRQVQDRIRNDFIVVSGDIVSDLKLDYMLEQHRAEGATLTVLLSENTLSGPVPGPVSDNGKYRDFTIIPADQDPPKLLYLVPEEDFEEEPPHSELFLNNRNVRLSSRFENCNIMVMKRGLLNVMRSLDDSFTSVNCDFIPYLLKLQSGHPDATINNLIFGTVPKKLNDESDEEEQTKDERTIKCYAYYAKIPSCTFMAHCNTIGPYFCANKAVLNSAKQFFTDDMIEHLRIGKPDPGMDGKSTVHMSVEVGQNVRITGSIVMRQCKIGSGAKIHNSIILEGATIGAKCVVSNSIVGAKEVVPEGERVTNSIQKTVRNFEV
ncbi:hypothetical protein FO519_002510 [Halicephalobus sp. NKZ332]|nr:hypothetical protein FO519_002510 [Halicephalobus sp. NKZ332]